MQTSSYVLIEGLGRTRATLAAWNRHPWQVLRLWLLGSLLAASVLLLAVWGVAALMPDDGYFYIRQPPLVPGQVGDALRIFGSNLLVLALHAMACVAGFIAGSSLPLQAAQTSGLRRRVHQHGGRIAIVFVGGATAFSLTVQALTLGHSVASVASAVSAPPGLLLLGLLPHALPELTALFLPLAAWILASRRGEWDSLLAATIVTVAISIPILVITALLEVYVAPHILRALIGYPA